MTADSDDVADSANKKPKGSISPPADADRAKDEEHATGEEQARRNREVDPPS